MTAFRNPGCMMNETTLGEDLRKYGQNPMKPRLWKLQRAIIGAERIQVYFPLTLDLLQDYDEEYYGGVNKNYQ